MFRDLVMTVAGMLWAAVLVLVGARFFALLAGADESSQLVAELYRRSDVLVQPFADILGLASKAVGDTGTFEPTSLAALGVYFIAGTVVLGLLRHAFFGGHRQHYA